MQTHLQQAAFNYETHKHCKHWKKRTATQYFEIKCFPGKPSSAKPSWGLNSWLYQHGLGRKGDPNAIKLRAKINAHIYIIEIYNWIFMPTVFFLFRLVIISQRLVSWSALQRFPWSTCTGSSCRCCNGAVVSAVSTTSLPHISKGVPN